METKQRICLLLVALLSLSGVLPAAATDAQASDYLPLAVGNSWTYGHDYRDTEGKDFDNHAVYWDLEYPGEPGRLPEFTITVKRTEVIDSKTYYVLSDMPANWPPAPEHFIAGKKLRWEGTHLMERTADGEQAIFRFDGTPADYLPADSYYGGYLIFDSEDSNVYRTEYAIPTMEGDNWIEVEASLKPVPWYQFGFFGTLEWRMCSFVASYGCNHCISVIIGSDFVAFHNELIPLRAVIGGTSVDFADALIPTSTSSSSWGQVKQSLLAGERRDR